VIKEKCIVEIYILVFVPVIYTCHNIFGVQKLLLIYQSLLYPTIDCLSSVNDFYWSVSSKVYVLSKCTYGPMNLDKLPQIPMPIPYTQGSPFYT